jgi:PAS domain S-box-containing protein
MKLTAQEQQFIDEEKDLFFIHSIDLLAIVGADGYFKKVNPAFERVLGFSEEEMYAKPLIDFLDPQDVFKTKKGMSALAAGVVRETSINRYKCKYGSYKCFSWNTTPLGPLFYTVGRDITEQVLMEERIRQLNSELTKKNEELEDKIQERIKQLQQRESQIQQLQKMDAIGRLAGGIAHDINNILGVIAISCDLLLEESTNPEAVKEKASDIQSITARATAFTRQLLIFNRKQIIQPQLVSLNSLLRELGKMLTRLIGENIRIVMNLAEDLKAIKMDPVQVEQIILNLVVNARDAMPTGGQITIETSNVYLDEEFVRRHHSVKKGNYILLTVSDNGCGIESAIVDKIFEPFFTTKPVGKGTGLGLSTTYGIANQNLGTILVDSVVGKGTAFKIYLPAFDGSPIAVESNPKKAPNIVGHSTILVVEDEEMLREVFSEALSKRGYQVLLARNGFEALEICRDYSDKIHLLLTDVVMPEVDGMELAKRAEVMRPGLRVLFMSGYANDVSNSREMIGASQFIEKPFNIGTLIGKIETALY